MIFYLGTHDPGWLGRAGVPLFISRRRLARRQHWPRAAVPWALDSGGFSEVPKLGRWETHPGRYAQEVYRWREAIGHLRWAAVQDWMCEPFVLARTGRSVREHQALTVESCQVLRLLAPDLPWAPVLQGWTIDDYLRHAESYAAAGVDLAAAPAVGVGSVCRRQGTRWAGDLFAALAPLGLKLHAFGLKAGGLRRSWPYLESSDSLAWSRGARSRRIRLPGCEHRGRDCRNCLRYALHWRGSVLAEVGRPVQARLAFKLDPLTR